MLRRTVFATAFYALSDIARAQAGAAGSLAREIFKDVSSKFLLTVVLDIYGVAKARLSDANAEAEKKIANVQFTEGTIGDQALVKMILERLWNPILMGEAKAIVLYEQVDFFSSGVVDRSSLCDWFNQQWLATDMLDKAWVKILGLRLEISLDRKLTTVRYRMDFLFKLHSTYEHGPRNQRAVIVDIDTNPRIIALKPAGLAGFLMWP